jgi:hypothetical protein
MNSIQSSISRQAIFEKHMPDNIRDYKESPKIANRITENCKSGESGFFELSFLSI